MKDVRIGIIGVNGGGVHGKEEYLVMPTVDVMTGVILEYARLLS